MFDFTLYDVLRDILIIGCCFIAIAAVAAVILYVRFRLYGEGPFVEYFKKEWKKPVVCYGVLTLALFFSVYASRLVLIKMILALCYAFVIARAFLRSDPR